MSEKKQINKQSLKRVFKTMVLFIVLLRFTASYPQSPTAYNLAELYDFNVKTVYMLYQAKNNHVWIGTDQGLFEFNGTTFKKYLNTAYQTEYSNIQEDKQGRIWCNNFSGQIFYVENQALKLFKDIDEYNYNTLYAYTIASFPKIYIGTSYGYLIADFHDSNNAKHFQTSYHNKEDYKILSTKDTIYKDHIKFIQPYNNKLIYHNIQAVNVLQKDSIKPLFPIGEVELAFLFSHDNKVLILCRDRENKLQIYRYQNDTTHLKKYNDLPKPNPPSIYYDHSRQHYWLGTVDGIYLLDKELNLSKHSFPFLKGNSVSGMMKDHEGNYWIATLRNGIYIIPSLAIKTINSSNSILQQNELIGMEKIGQDRLIFADNSGNVYQYNIPENKLVLLFTVGTDAAYMVYNPIRDAIHFYETDQYYDLKNKQWVHSNLRYIKAGTAVDSVNFLISQGGMALITNFEAAKDKLPMSTSWQQRYMMFKRHGPPNRLLLRKKRTYLNGFCKATRTMYVGYSDGLFSYKNAIEEQIFYNDVPLLVTALHPAREKGIWAVNTEGVLYYVLENKASPIDTFNIEIRHIRQKDSLLFLGTNEGLIKYNLNSKQKEVINTLDGLPSNAITGLAIVGDKVFVATLKGLASVPVTYNYKNTVAPEVSLTKMTVNGKIREPGTSLELKPKENNLTFFFNAYALRSQKTFTYAYRMLGVDSTWATTRTHTVSFAALRPDQYTFQLKAINEDGMESGKIQQLQFTINSPFYQKWWFYVLISLGSIAFVSYLFNYRISNIKKQNNLQQHQKALEKKLAASTISTLKAQMNPHFMFNAMNSIQSLILKGDRDEAYTYLTKFSSLIRENLNMSEKNFVYFTEELELINTYLDLEQLRFRTGFEYTIKGAAQIDDIKIPAMIIQPFIENAIKHGLLHKSGIKKLRIHFQQNEVLSCIVTDNGIGRKASGAINKKRRDKHASFATGAIEKRFALLREYYKLDLGFVYTDLEEDGKPSGTEVIIKIPYLKDDV